MAQNPIPLAEMVKINDQNVSDVEGISDLLQDAPFLAATYATDSSNGTKHSYLKETAAPVVGFRAANDGIDHDTSEDTNVTIDLAILDASHHHDQSLVDQYRYGASAYMAREGNRHLQAGFFMAEQQMIYGQAAGAANGFTGMIDVLSALANAQVLGAGGTTALSSVYAVRTVPSDTDFAVVMGDEGNIAIGDIYQQMMDGATSGIFNAYVQPISAYLGVQVGSIFSMARLANVDDSANSLNDDLLSNLLSLAPSGRQFTHLVMNRRSLQQLQASRTATSPSGAPAPFPDNAYNVPIIVTDSVVSDETVVA